LDSECYKQMFYNCSLLQRAPILPAISLIYDCYRLMFYNCSSLNYVKAMFTSTPANGGNTHYWLGGVATTGTFVKNAAATWTTVGPSGVPSGWTIETASS